MGGIVSKIIMHYLKEFLEPASTQQMKLKIFKGSLVLNNIELKSTALTSQLIPFIVRKGTIGYIDVSFPWKKLNKNPTIITIRDVFVVLQFDGRILLKKDMQASRDALHVEQEQTSPVAEKQSFIQGIFETIIDNVRINIENIHICVEIPIEETTISIGLVIKKINLSTLDENDKVITSIVHPKSVHKGLTITGLAAYFDTFSDQIPIDLFQQTMKDQITGEHQFLLSPTDISTILIHSHDPQDKYTNQLSVNIPKIKLGLDFHQCRALVSLSSMVRKLQNSRRYASCNRPKSFENCSKVWRYMHRCALVQNHPINFKPKLALNILKNRIQYLKYFQKVRNSKNTTNRIGSPKYNLSSFQNKIGKEPSLFLQEYSEAICIKEEALKEIGSLTDIDLSELKNFRQAKEFIFSMKQLYGSLNIDSIKFEMKYTINEPIIKGKLSKFTSTLDSLPTGAKANLKIEKFYIKSPNKNNNNEMFEHLNIENEIFLNGDCIIPSTPDMTTINLTISPLQIIVDLDTIFHLTELFTDQSIQFLPEKLRITYFDFGEKIQPIKLIKNYSLNLNIPSFRITIPYTTNQENDSIDFILYDFNLSKPQTKIIADNVQLIPINFVINFSLKFLLTNEIVMFESQNLKTDLSLVLYDQKINADITIDFSLDSFSLYLVQTNIVSLLNALQSITSLSLFQRKKNSKQIFVFGKNKLFLTAKIPNINIILDDGIADKLMKISLGPIISKITYEDEKLNLNANIMPIKINHINELFMEIQNPINITFDLINNTQTITINIDKIHGFLLFDTLQWLLKYMDSIIKTIPKPKQIQNQNQINNVKSNINLNVQVTNTIFEMKIPKENLMIDLKTIEVKNKNNNLSSLNVNISDLSIYKGNHFILKPFNLNIPINFPNPFDLQIDFVEVGIIPEDINPLFDYIPQILKFMVKLREMPFMPEKIQLYLKVKKVKLLILENIESYISQLSILNINLNLFLTRKSIKTNVDIDKIRGYYLDKLSFIKIPDKLHVEFNLLDNNIEVLTNLSKTNVKVKEELIYWALRFKFNTENLKGKDETDINKPSKTIKINLNLKPINITLLKKTKNLIKLFIDETTINLTKDEKIGIDLNSNGLTIKTDYIKQKVVKFEQLKFQLLKDRLFARIPKVIIYISIPYIFKVIKYIKNIIPKNNNLVQYNTILDETNNKQMKIPMINIDFLMEGMQINILPKQNDVKTHYLSINIPTIQLAFNSFYKLIALNIGSIIISTICHKRRPTIKISGIKLSLSFSDDNDINLVTFDYINSLPTNNNNNENNIIEKINLTFKVEQIQVLYTNLFASTIINCLVFDFNMLPKNNFNLPMKMIPINLEVQLNDFQIVMIMVEPIATFLLSEINLKYNFGDLDASISKVNVISKEGESMPIIKTLTNDNLIKIQFKNKELFCIFSEAQIYVDYQLLTSIVTFIMSSPLLELMKNDNTNTKQMIKQQSSFSSMNSLNSFSSLNSLESIEGLQITIIVRIPIINIIIPSSLNPEDNMNLNINFGCLLELSNRRTSIALENFNVFISNPITKQSFSPLISDFGFVATIRKTSKGLSITMNIIELIIKISVFDILLFKQIIESIQKTVELRTYTYEETNFKSKFQLEDIRITSEKIELILCEDNKSSKSLFIPIFRFIIPQINTIATLTQTVNTFMIELTPYLEFFNNITGSYDFIIETFPLLLILVLTEETTQINLQVQKDYNININLPIFAITRIKKIIKILKAQINFSQRYLRSSELPILSISNELESYILIKQKGVELKLLPTEILPIFNVNDSNLNMIEFKYKNLQFNFNPNSISYPTYITSYQNKNIIICVNKIPYKCGLLITLKSPVQIENLLSVPFDLYYKNEKENKLINLGTINPKKRFSLTLSPNVNNYYTIIPININSNNVQKYFYFTISYENDKIEIFQVPINKSYFNCIKVPYIDYLSGIKVFAIKSQFIIRNYLPYHIHIRSNDNEIPITIKSNGKNNLYFGNILNKDTFIMSLSYDGEHWASTSIKLKYEKPQRIEIFNNKSNTIDSIVCTIEKNNEEEEQFSIIIFSPCIIFNESSLFLIINKEILIKPFSNSNYCPKMIFNNNSESLKLNVVAKEISKETNEFIDCNKSGYSTLLLPSIQKNFFVPLTYNLNHSMSTVVITFFSSIKIINNLDINFKLIPTDKLPIFNEKELMNNVASNKFMGKKIGNSILCQSNTEILITTVTKKGYYYIKVKGFSTYPIISLFEPKKTVFRVQNSMKSILMELNVIKSETGYTIKFNPIEFPTPITIANQLDVQIFAFQFICFKPFEVLPNSTSLFAFDEPLAYPSMQILFDKCCYNISLVEDTQPIQMEQKYKNKFVYVQVKSNSIGNRMVIITYDPNHSYSLLSKFSLYLQIPRIFLSVIDQNMREFILITLNSINFDFIQRESGLSVKFNLKNLQMDDQISMNSILYGRNDSNDRPFISFQCICSPDTPLFTSFQFISLILQRIDININSNFIFELICVFNLLKKFNKMKIEPAKTKNFESISLININWFEVSPIFLVISFNKSNDRNSIYNNKMPSYFKYLKLISINSKKILIPGIFIAHLIDQIQSLIEKISDDYKTVAFNQMIQMLGASGVVLNAFNIPSIIATKYLNLTSLTSELSNEINDFTQTVAERYDNRKVLHGYFSVEIMKQLVHQLNQNNFYITPLVIGVLHNKNTGIQIKRVSGYSYGVGVAGVLTKSFIEKMESTQSMQNILQARPMRAYIENRINIYNNEVANSQLLISRNSNSNEQIKLIIKYLGNNNLICITNVNIYIVKSDVSVILDHALIKLMVGIKVEANTLTILFKERSPMILKIDRKYLDSVKLFLLSQNEMQRIFGRSIII